MAISLKALVDTEKNKVVFIEADEHFLDVLFSFLTMPMGTIIKNTRYGLPTFSVGCMNNLYASVEKLDVKYFRTAFCRTILLCPLNAAGNEYENLKIKIDNSYPSWYYLCPSTSCTTSRHEFVSYSARSVCDCGEIMTKYTDVFKGKQDDFSSDARDGVFAKALVRQLVTDDLQLLLTSTTSSFGLLSRLGVTNYDALEEKNFSIEGNKALHLLKYSLISNTPLTEVLLKPEAIGSELRKDDAFKSKHTGYQKKEQHTSEGSNEISIKLVTSKSDRKVCYAEAGKDFVDLLFSFLTVPLGYILKETSNESSKGCINHLYESVRDIDADKCMKSVDIKNLLLCPKVAPYHSYPNHPLGLEEAKQQIYYYRYQRFQGVEERLTTDARIVPSGCTSKGVALSLKDPKSPPHKDTSTVGGYVFGPAVFTISDDLVIVPISPVSALRNLKKRKVSFLDVEEQVVNVGKEEALRLLIAAFSSDSALTDAFLG